VRQVGHLPELFMHLQQEFGFWEHPVYLTSVHISVNKSKIVVVGDVIAMVIWVYFMFDRSISQFRRLSRAEVGFIAFQSDKLYRP
jgi:hypothetical protein